MDKIKYNKKKRVVEGTFDIFIYRDGDIYYAIISSLDLSGYGNTINEAIKELKNDYDTFCSSMINDPQYDLDAYLTSIGFKRDIYAKKRYSNAQVDHQELKDHFPRLKHVDTKKQYSFA